MTDTVAAGRALSEAPYIVPPPEPPQTAQRPGPAQPDSHHHQPAQVQHPAVLGNGPDALRRTGAQQQQLQQQLQPGSRLPPQRPGSAAYSAGPQPAARGAPASITEQHNQQHARTAAEDQNRGSKAPELTG